MADPDACTERLLTPAMVQDETKIDEIQQQHLLTYPHPAHVIQVSFVPHRVFNNLGGEITLYQEAVGLVRLASVYYTCTPLRCQFSDYKPPYDNHAFVTLCCSTVHMCRTDQR